MWFIKKKKKNRLGENKGKSNYKDRERQDAGKEGGQ
jgi:hypothetical protein